MRKDLKIKKLKVVINDNFTTTTTLADYIFGRDTIEISNNYETNYNLYFAIAHEFRHKYQIMNNLFNFDCYKTRKE